MNRYPVNIRPSTTGALFFILIMISGSVEAQSPKVRALMDTSLYLMKKYSVNSKEVDWPKITTEVNKRIKTFDHPYQLGDTYRYLFEALNDFHGSIMVADSTFRWSHKEPVVNDSITKAWSSKIYFLPRKLTPDIGYIRIPYMYFTEREEANRKSQILNDSLCYLASQNIKGKVIDLRLNGGGSMQLMMLGLKQLFAEGKLGSFIPGENYDWKILNNTFIQGKDTIASIKPLCNFDLSHIPVVIITSPSTGSSGEFLVIAFKGRGNTTLLGATTAGYVTSVKAYSIDEFNLLYLSTGYGVDKKGKVYRSAIRPDIAMAATDQFNNIDRDQKVKSAVDFLMKKKK